MRTAKYMMESKWHHVIYGCLAGAHHYIFDRVKKLFFISFGGHILGFDECLTYPFICNLFGTQRGIPGKTTESIPVGLSEDVAAKLGS